ncbi:MAG: secretion protein F [Clostridia bacterium]
MKYIILITVGTICAFGIYFLLAHFLKIPTFRATKTIMGIGKSKKKQINSAEVTLMNMSIWLSKYIRLSDDTAKRLNNMLRCAEISKTPQVFVAQTFIKSGIIAIGGLLCLVVIPILSSVLLVTSIGMYFNEMSRFDKIVSAKREEIECELPRFVATLSQSLIATKDLRTILEKYAVNAGQALKNELTITTADMSTGNYQAALTRFDARVSSGMLSQIISGMQTVINGGDGVAHLQMLTRDMKQFELIKLEKLAKERPPKIRKYSLLLLGCMIMMYMGVMGYQIIGTMSGLF